MRVLIGVMVGIVAVVGCGQAGDTAAAEGAGGDAGAVAWGQADAPCTAEAEQAECLVDLGADPFMYRAECCLDGLCKTPEHETYTADGLFTLICQTDGHTGRVRWLDPS